ncbi:hypothetical protein BCR37DRAFT_380414 [Protomyces lactucae-debilis]|uniref:Ubiquitin carboxyl-terminal hydrolase n=1 Tax=Protomyces lactucae-debilis TaxID=2754530 RepID=A0A1Y2FDM0_PROLT|nr:uncharacterized protein BCR37DRAFT_380414 [Protomyces lactucae-debilis]ORY81514.1 hypothetical protein BCR37DRAFT_380414 [Protomyces lactucae-debilis]
MASLAGTALLRIRSQMSRLSAKSSEPAGRSGDVAFSTSSSSGLLANQDILFYAPSEEEDRSRDELSWCVVSQMTNASPLQTRQPTTQQRDPSIAQGSFIHALEVPEPAMRETRFEALKRRGQVDADIDGMPVDFWLTTAKKLYRSAQVCEERGQLEDAFLFYARTYDLMSERIPRHHAYAQWKTTNIEGRRELSEFRSVLAGEIESYGALMMKLKRQLSDSADERPASSSSHRSSLRSNGRSPHLPPATAGPVVLAKTNNIEAPRLIQYLRENRDAKVLFLDIRPRPDFERQHIDMPSVACIDPLVCRDNVHCQDLEDSFAVAPEEELKMFEARHEYNLIVFYDNKSTMLDDPRNDDLYTHKVLKNMYTALWEKSGWRKPLSRPPMLLVGGINAWMRAGGAIVNMPNDDGTHTPPSKSSVGAVLASPPVTPEQSEKQRNRVISVIGPRNGDMPYARSVQEYIANYVDRKSSQSMVSPVESFAKLKLKPLPVPNTAPLSVRLPQNKVPSPYLIDANVRRPPQGPASRPLPAFARQPSIGGQISRLGQVTIGKTGLKNLGNSCFMNAVLQCLSACFPLARYFTSGRYKEDVNLSNPLGYKGDIARRFAELLRDLASDDNTVVAPVNLRAQIGKIRPEFASNNQEDAQELMVFLLDGLHEDLNGHAQRPNLRELTEAEEEVKERMPDLKVSSIEWARYQHRNKSVIVDLFQGQLQSRLRCLTCGHQSTTYNAFTSLSLPIPKQPHLSLTSCLDEFVKSESMDGEDSWHCAKCKTLRKATKRLAISKLPDVLLIHFKRFETKGPWRDKINVDISFPLKALDMTDYLGHLGGDQVSSIYDLFGIVYHRGSMEGGHYTAMVSADPTNDWTLFDDSRVAPSNQIDGRAAYILFYQKRSQAI